MAKNDKNEIKNTINLVGEVAELELTETQTKEKGIPMFAVKCTVKFGEENYEALTFKLLCTETNKDGQEKKSYAPMLEMFQSIVENKLTIADGAETPARIAVLAKFEDGFFWDADGNFKDVATVSSSYAKLATSKDGENKAEFLMDVYLKDIKKETIKDSDGDEEETGRLRVSGFTWDFQGRPVPFNNFVVEADLAEDFENYYEEGVMTKLEGTWKCTQEKAASEGKGIGKKKERTFTRTEKIITYGYDPYEEDSEKYEKKIGEDAEVLRKALKERQVLIDSDERNPVNKEDSNGSITKSSSDKESAKEKKKNAAKLF